MASPVSPGVPTTVLIVDNGSLRAAATLSPGQCFEGGKVPEFDEREVLGQDGLFPHTPAFCRIEFDTTPSLDFDF